MTDYLFSMPRTLFGMCRVLDLGAVFTQYNVSPTPEIADSHAIRSDWVAVGNDLRAALREYARSCEKNLEEKKQAPKKAGESAEKRRLSASRS